MYESKKSLTSFDDVLNAVGNYGWFQKRYYIIFVCCFTFFASQTYFNYVVALTSPDHWCKVPGRNSTNFTIEEWKSLTIPTKFDEWGNEGFSNCQMYNATQMGVAVDEPTKIVDCQHGWEYNTTWYLETVTSRENWVCDYDFYAPNIFAFSRMSEIFGSIVASYLGDTYGRKTTFKITFIILIVGRISLIFTSASFTTFLTAILFGSFASVNMLISTLVIGMEISDEKNHGFIMMMQTSAWALGMGAMSLIMWAVGDWKYFLWATTLPGIICLLLAKYMVESPRWLMSQGKITKCMKELSEIAKVNGTKLPENTAVVLTSLPKQNNKNYGILSFFSQWRIAKNTICLNVSWSATGLSYYVLILYFGRFGSNPFITSFFQGVVEIPSSLVGMVACNYIGRRWSHVLGHFGTVLGCIPLIFIINDTNLEWLTAILTVYLKFTVVLSIYVLYLHTMEAYPTCLRQSGVTFGNLTTNISSVLGPYIVYLGSTVDARWPFIILLLIALISCCCVFLLPETLHQVLPETLEEAKDFGSNQSYWSLPKKKKEFQLVQNLEIN